MDFWLAPCPHREYTSCKIQEKSWYFFFGHPVHRAQIDHNQTWFHLNRIFMVLWIESVFHHLYSTPQRALDPKVHMNNPYILKKEFSILLSGHIRLIVRQLRIRNALFHANMLCLTRYMFATFFHSNPCSFIIIYWLLIRYLPWELMSFFDIDRNISFPLVIMK